MNKNPFPDKMFFPQMSFVRMKPQGKIIQGSRVRQALTLFAISFQEICGRPGMLSGSGWGLDEF